MINLDPSTLVFADVQAVAPVRPEQVPAGITLLPQRPDNLCVGCGGANPFGLGLWFVQDAEGMVHTWVRPTERMQGALSMTRGGYISLLLDETMGKSLSSRGIKAPTATLQVHFRRPMLLSALYTVRSWIDRIDGRKNMVRGEIRAVADPDRVIAEADALFITVRS
jgi:acyl-coenzyme A thioesterase PaaI-like protein